MRKIMLQHFLTFADKNRQAKSNAHCPQLPLTAGTPLALVATVSLLLQIIQTYLLKIIIKIQMHSYQEGEEHGKDIFMKYGKNFKLYHKMRKFVSKTKQSPREEKFIPNKIYSR